MNRLIHHSATAASALLLSAVAACGGGGGNGSAEPVAETTSESPMAAASMLQTADSEYGTILVDSEGMTVYMFDPDQQGPSTCEGDCLVAWPPVEGPAEAGQGVDQSLLGTTKAPDGTTMATYNDWPLYYWQQDKQAGDVTGQAVNDVWWVMGPDGKPIREEPGPAGGGDGQAASTIETADSEYGTILVDSEGMTVYMFDPDQQGPSTCEGDCLVAWPPVEGPAEAGQGVDQSLLGTTKAPDGTTMATYNDWPLYYWQQDKQAGDVTGQAVNDVWWVMGPDGKPIRQMP